MNKRNLIIVIVVLVALVGAVVLWNQKSNQQNTNQEEQRTIKQTQEQKTVQEEQANQNQINEELTQKEQIDTSNWKTYRNEELGFEVKYPEEWGVKKMKFVTIWPAPVPIDCEKTPEKCPFEGMQLFSSNSQDDKIKYITIKILTSDDRHGMNDGFNVNKIKGSEFAPGDYCLYSYVREIGNKKSLLVTGLDYFDNRCDKDNRNKLFNYVVDSIK